MTTRLDGGRLLAGLGAAVLLVCLFLDWYGASGAGDAINAWRAFELVDVVLAACAIALLIATVPHPIDQIPTPGDNLSTLLAATPFALVVVSLINPPPGLGDAEIELGAWIALIASAAILAGRLSANNRISIVVAPREDPAPAEPAAARAGSERETEMMAEPKPPGPQGPPR